MVMDTPNAQTITKWQTLYLSAISCHGHAMLNAFQQIATNNQKAKPRPQVKVPKFLPKTCLLTFDHGA